MGCPGRDHHTHTGRISSGREGLTRQQIKLDALSVPEYVHRVGDCGDGIITQTHMNCLGGGP